MSIGCMFKLSLFYDSASGHGAYFVMLLLKFGEVAIFSLAQVLNFVKHELPKRPFYCKFEQKLYQNSNLKKACIL